MHTHMPMHTCTWSRPLSEQQRQGRQHQLRCRSVGLHLLSTLYPLDLPLMDWARSAVLANFLNRNVDVVAVAS